MNPHNKSRAESAWKAGCSIHEKLIQGALAEGLQEHVTTIMNRYMGEVWAAFLRSQAGLPYKLGRIYTYNVVNF